MQFEECKNEDLLQGSIEGIMRGDQSFQNVMKLNVTAVANDDADRSFKAKQLFPNSKSQQSAEGAEIIASAFFTALREKRKKYVNWINDFTSRLETSGDKTQSQIKTFVGKVEVIIAQIDVMSRKDFKTALYSTTNAIIARASKGGQLEKFKNKNEFNALIGINSPEQLKILPPDIQTMVADFQVYMEAYLLDFVPGKKKVLTKPQLTVVNASK